jgi:hypothetical protein
MTIQLSCSWIDPISLGRSRHSADRTNDRARTERRDQTVWKRVSVHDLLVAFGDTFFLKIAC